MKNLIPAFIYLLIMACPAYSVTISGYVINNEGGIEGVLVSGNEVVDAGISDSNGFYEVLVLSGWSGVLTASKMGMAFEPAERQYDNITDSLSNQDFEETVQLQSITKRVSHSYDDGHCWRRFEGGASCGWSGETLIVGSDGYEEEAMCGFRFTSVDIPQKAVILNANLRVKRGNYLLWGPVSVQIRGEYVDNASDFHSFGAPIFLRPTTSSKANWYLGSSWEVGTWATSPDVHNIVQQIINRTGWSAGNAMAFFVKAYNYYYDPGYRSFYSYNHSTSDAAYLDVTYKYPPLISGFVKTSEGVGISSVQISSDHGGTVGVSGSNGYYELRVPPAWTGTITPSKPYWQFEPNELSFSILYSDRNNQNFVGISPVKISGFVDDNDGNGIAEVEVSADSGGGSGISDSNGYYELWVPYDWSGSVVAQNKYWFFEPNELIFENMVEDIAEQNFLGTAGIVISGHIANNSGISLEDVMVIADNGGKTESTDANGYYELSVPPEWFGTLTPQKCGRRFMPAYRSYDVLMTGLIGQDYQALEIVVSSEGNGYCATVREAVDDAVDGDEIIIYPGVYQQNQPVYINNKGITIRSIDPNDPRIVMATVIEGYGFDFNGSGSKEAELQGLTIRGFSLSFSWGVRCYESSPTIYNCVLSGHSEGIHLYYSDAKIIGCTVKENGYNYYEEYCGNAINCLYSNVEIRNCIISNNAGFGVSANFDSNVGLVNCTIVDNKPCFVYNEQWIGGGVYSYGASVSLKNSILWNNHEPNGFEIQISNYPGNEANSVVEVSYGDVEGGQSDIYIEPTSNCVVVWGEDNIDTDPCFAESGYWDPNGTPSDTNDDFWVDGDYHLKSEGWRWDPNLYRSSDFTQDGIVNFKDFANLAGFWLFEASNLPVDLNRDGAVNLEDLSIFSKKFLTSGSTGGWTFDSVTSRCIDAGNPGSPLANEPMSVPDDPCNIWGENIRINMGAYGGTAEASMPPYDWAILADLTNDGIVDYIDLGHWVENWLSSGSELPSDLNRNGVVDMFDFALFGQDWPIETSWHTP